MTINLRQRHFGRIIALIAFTLLLVLSGCTTTEPDVASATTEQKIEEAIAAFSSREYDRAFDLLQPLAARENAEAKYYLGLIYLSRGQTDQDAKLAFAQFQSSASLGFQRAMWELGRAYDEGVGVQQDVMLAMDWYRKSRQVAKEEKQGKTVTYYYLDKDGNGPHSLEKHIELVERLAREGDVKAQAALADIHDVGGVGPYNQEKAFFWTEKAANNGDKYAQERLGYFYCRGIGVPSDPLLANHWLLESGRNVRCTTG